MCRARVRLSLLGLKMKYYNSKNSDTDMCMFNTHQSVQRHVGCGYLADRSDLAVLPSGLHSAVT